VILPEIGAKLAALGLGVVGTTIFLGSMPETPTACCAVIEYGGAPPEMGFGLAGVKYETPAIQVMFRGAEGSYAATRALAEAAYRGLCEVETTTLSGTFYHHIHPQQSPFSLKRDDSKRVYIACNFLAEKEPSAA